MQTNESDSVPIITDVLGTPLASGSIVEVINEGSWCSHQGRVVELNSNIEGDEYSVPVFFDTEVSQSSFWHIDTNKESGIVPIKVWDLNYGKLSNDEKITLLTEGDTWIKCPRIVFFRPDELKVVPEWKTNVLVKRLFGRRYHSLREVDLPLTISEFTCFCEDCYNVASKTALYNEWGTVTGHYVCETCFPIINGICGEIPPRMKKRILRADGSVFVVAKSM